MNQAMAEACKTRIAKASKPIPKKKLGYFRPVFSPSMECEIVE